MDDKQLRAILAERSLQRRATPVVAELAEYKRRLRDDLSKYLDIIQELLTFAEELPEKKRTQLLGIIDKMIEHYKDLEANTEKVVGAEDEKWSSLRRQ